MLPPRLYPQLWRDNMQCRSSPLVGEECASLRALLQKKCERKNCATVDSLFATDTKRVFARAPSV